MTVESWSRTRPTFAHEPARWLLGRLNDLNIGIDVDERIRGLIAIDKNNRTLLLPPGLSWEAAHFLICRGTLFMTGGPAWAPEFVEPTPRPKAEETCDALMLEPSTNKVIPFVRRPW